MSRTSSEVKNRYNAKAYDRITTVVPKGRKMDVEAFAEKQGVSVNALINGLLQRELGLSDEAWKDKENSNN